MFYNVYIIVRSPLRMRKTIFAASALNVYWAMNRLLSYQHLHFIGSGGFRRHLKGIKTKPQSGRIALLRIAAACSVVSCDLKLCNGLQSTEPSQAMRCTMWPAIARCTGRIFPASRRYHQASLSKSSGSHTSRLKCMLAHAIMKEKA